MRARRSSTCSGPGMRKTLTITDVTEMREDEVCIAGIDEGGSCVRPVIPGGVRLHDLYNRSTAIVVPGRRVELEVFGAEIEQNDDKSWTIKKLPPLPDEESDE